MIDLQRLKKLIPIVLLMTVLFILSACGASLQKPTGLEDNNESTEVVENDSSNETENKTKEQDSKKDKADKKDKNIDKNDESEEEENEEDKQGDDEEKKQTTQLTKEETKEKQPKVSNEAKNSNHQSTKSSATNNDSSTSSNSVTKQESTPKPVPKKKASSNQSDNKNTEQSKPKPKPTPSKPKEEKKTVTLSIKISSSEVPLGATQVTMNDGETVLDALNRITKEKGIHRDVTGGGSSAYVKGLANVYEFDRGQGSGWMYRINGVFPDRGVGAVKIQPGDNIEFLYTLDLGKDLNANLQPYRR